MSEDAVPAPSGAAGLTLLATKLFSPRVRPGLVDRPRLRERLGEAVQQPLTLVCAPAGYGKTTLIATWLAQAECPATWLSLDEGDNDPVRFFSYLVAAVRSADPLAGQATLNLLALPQLPQVETLLAPLINDLAGFDSQFALVLDDYHAIANDQIHAAIELLVGNPPPALHLVISTRRDPPLPLARLRARGQLVEVRAQDLRFTAREATAFFGRTMGLDLDDNAVRALTDRTEGWVAGLQLAALSLQGREDVEGFLADFSGSDRYVIDYLMAEVLRHQPAEVQSFLRQTSVLDRLCGPLCDALTGRSDGAATLSWLEQASLFLLPTDNARGWYRYHRLFADVLRSELEPEREAALHARAAAWFEAQGQTAEAIAHALRGGNPLVALDLVTKAAEEAFRRGEFVTLGGWLDALPPELLRQDLDLSGYRAWVALMTGRLAEAEAAGTQFLGRLQPASDTPGLGRLLALRAWLARDRDETASEAFALKALDLLGDEQSFWRLMALLPLGHVQARTGKTAMAGRTFAEAYRIGQRLGHPLATLGALAGLVPNMNREGRRREAEALCRQALAEMVDTRGRPLPLAGTIYIPLGMLCYEADELERASEYTRLGKELCRQASLELQMLGDGEWTLARIASARGEPERALAIARETRQLAEQAGMGRAASMFAAMEAHFALRAGDLAAANRWAETSGLLDAAAPQPSTEFARVTLARVLLAGRRYREANALLERLATAAEAEGRGGRLIAIHILCALTERALGQAQTAHAHLAAAVDLAAPEGYRRAFLDDGPAVAAMLPAIRQTAPTFVAELLAAFDRSSGMASSPQRVLVASQPSTAGGDGHRSPAPQPDQGALVEPLSERELEILRLIAAGRSNAEIADQLFITHGTAKWHAYNIYGKLGARTRTQAVARARELGLA